MGDPATLQEVLESFWDLKTNDVNISLPAIVESVDTTLNTVTLKMGIKTKYDGEMSSEELPKVQDVPIALPRTAISKQIEPIEVGNKGWAVFCSRSISEYVAGAGNPVYPEDSRQFDLSDAYFIPGGYPSGDPWTLQVPSGAVGYSLQPNAKMWLGGDKNITLPLNSAKDDVINIIYALIQIVTVIDATPNPSGANSAKLGELLTALAKRVV